MTFGSFLGLYRAINLKANNLLNSMAVTIGSFTIDSQTIAACHGLDKQYKLLELIELRRNRVLCIEAADFLPKLLCALQYSAVEDLNGSVQQGWYPSYHPRPIGKGLTQHIHVICYWQASMHYFHKLPRGLACIGFKLHNYHARTNTGIQAMEIETSS